MLNKLKEMVKGVEKEFCMSEKAAYTIAAAFLIKSIVEDTEEEIGEVIKELFENLTTVYGVEFGGRVDDEFVLQFGEMVEKILKEELNIDVELQTQTRSDGRQEGLTHYKDALVRTLLLIKSGGELTLDLAMKAVGVVASEISFKDNSDETMIGKYLSEVKGFLEEELNVEFGDNFKKELGYIIKVLKDIQGLSKDASDEEITAVLSKYRSLEKAAPKEKEKKKLSLKDRLDMKYL